MHGTKHPWEYTMDRKRSFEGYVFFTLFLLTIPIANWMIGNVGTHCVPKGPCLIPVFPFGVDAPSGVLMIGIALVLRDLVHRRLGWRWSLGAIAVGGAFSFAVATPALVTASVLAFYLSELADLFVYAPLQRRRFLLAVVASGLVGLAVDSAVFLYVAFGSLDYFWGQAIGKGWMILLAIPVCIWLRDRDERIGMYPAN